MVYLQYLISIVFGILGLWVFVMNWCIFFYCLFTKKHVSWLPLIAGIFLSIAWIAWPENPYRWYFWIAFIVDWGSLPSIGHAVIYILFFYKDES
jgi:hypothetical protein